MNDPVKQDVSTDNISDNEIVARVLNGEKDLYALLIRKYNQRLYRIAMSVINDDDEAEDIMKVDYIRAYENLERFEWRSGFSTWLTRILINESLLRVRKRKRLSTMEENILIEKSHGRTAEASTTPLMQVLNNELKSAIEDAIRKLPEKYRTVFIMREIENMNIAETRECLNISEVNVKVRLNRAKAMLRESLSAYYHNDEILHFHLSRCDRVASRVMAMIKSY